MDRIGLDCQGQRQPQNNDREGGQPHRFLDVFRGIRPTCSAGFQTCGAADFQIGR